MDFNHQCFHKEMVSYQYSTRPFKFTMSLAMHWVTSSSTGRNLAVYDSKFTSGDLSSSLTPSICRLLAERMRMEMILTLQCWWLSYHMCNSRKELLAFKINLSQQPVNASRGRKCSWPAQPHMAWVTFLLGRSNSSGAVRCMPETYGDMIACNKTGVGLEKPRPKQQQWNCNKCSIALRKHLGYFNHILRLSQLHQCDQGMLSNRFLERSLRSFFLSQRVGRLSM